MYPRIDFDLIAVFSDGALSFFQQKSGGVNSHIPLPNVLQQLMLFKGLKGEFVTRRCRKFFRKFCVENDWSHYDDFSMVALYSDDNKDTVKKET